MSQANEGVSATPGTPSSPSRRTLAAGAFGGLFVALGEFGPLATEWREISFETLTVVEFLLPLFVIPILVVGLHGVIVAGLTRLAFHYAGRRAAVAVVLLFAAAMGGLWQDTLMEGDGIRALPYYEAIRVAGWVVGPLVVMAAAWLLVLFDRLTARSRSLLAGVLAIAGLVASHLVFPAHYRPFHGFATLASGALAAWALAPWLRGRIAARASWALLGFSGLIVVALPGWTSGQRYVQGHTHAPAAMLKLPTTRPWERPPEHLIDPDATFTAEQEAGFRDELRANRVTEHEPLGTNVLLVVLEATRADTWNDPIVATRFHANWRERGLYIPEAISQYPATPLAYGAMFTSQTPSVLTQTPSWGRTRLFDRIAGRFDHLIFARPHNAWFDHGAITEFFVPKGVEVPEHGHVRVGLSTVRSKLARVKRGDSFFAWVHIYEPHRPWRLRREFGDRRAADGSREAHISEVAFVDDHLGGFMEWFYVQPYARNTLVIVISDHGEALGEVVEGKPFWGHHIHVRNTLSHVPAFFSGPGIPRDVITRDVSFQQLDVMPTIFDFLGEELPESALAQGRSLYDLLEQKPKRDLVTEAFSIRGRDFFDFVVEVREERGVDIREKFREVSTDGKYPPKIALQYGDHKLIRNRLTGATEIYDIDDDRTETDNLVSEAPEIRAQLQERLDAWGARQSWIVKQLESRP